ncbi:hypothetical protein PR202_gb23882 [Eleusine coracana subsp. coracana]|uniref:Uncharacterized protein n=1 Tax=Eleusine coracana subsp. coracana TaxID=191504 RepID=A0AAV5FK72_ELECO|nr:hypothetical protein PR202_gb23882 [Eleusine coracana subsp. coracana]
MRDEKQHALKQQHIDVNQIKRTSNKSTPSLYTSEAKVAPLSSDSAGLVYQVSSIASTLLSGNSFTAPPSPGRGGEASGLEDLGGEGGAAPYRDP